MRSLLLLLALTFIGSPLVAAEPVGEPLTLVVMDPLAAPLACDCVQGYAQRKYENLATFLTNKLKRRVNVYWSESLVNALKQKTDGKVDIVIGKHSVVLHDAKTSKLELLPTASLSGLDGETIQTGLIVVRTADPAKTVADLKGYRILFGPADCDEKSLAPMTLLKQNGVDIPKMPETHPACSTAATALVEFDKSIKAAAVISSYAEPLLEGCGAVKKGDLRVIGTSDPVPFVTAFVNSKLSKEDQAAIHEALLDVSTDGELLISLETLDGFVEYKELPAPGEKKTETDSPAIGAAKEAATDSTDAKKK